MDHETKIHAILDRLPTDQKAVIKFITALRIRIDLMLRDLKRYEQERNHFFWYLAALIKRDGSVVTIEHDVLRALELAEMSYEIETISDQEHEVTYLRLKLKESGSDGKVH